MCRIVLFIEDTFTYFQLKTLFDQGCPNFCTQLWAEVFALNYGAVRQEGVRLLENEPVERLGSVMYRQYNVHAMTNNNLNV